MPGEAVIYPKLFIPGPTHVTPAILKAIGNGLGSANINIRDALLGREGSAERAFSVIKADSEPDEKRMQKLPALDGILDIRKVSA
jgi:hypothetical protein